MPSGIHRFPIKHDNAVRASLVPAMAKGMHTGASNESNSSKNNKSGGSFPGGSILTRRLYAKSLGRCRFGHHAGSESSPRVGLN
jgi:hypothetical protein